MKGTVTSFHNLYQRYAKEVYRFAFWLSGDAEEAKDLTSETFIRLWTAKNDLRQETVKGYLFTITRNLYLQGLRKKDKKLTLDEAWADPGPLPDAAIEAHSELKLTLKRLQKLPESDRAALILRAREGLSIAEIARVLGLSVSAVKVKIHRARIKLVKLAEKAGDKTYENYK